MMPDRRVIHLMLIETSGVAGKNLVLLHNDATDLLSAGIGVDVKWLLKVRKREQYGLGKRFLDSVKCFRVARQPVERDFGAGESVERLAQCRLVGYHISIVINHSEEAA